MADCCSVSLIAAGGVSPLIYSSRFYPLLLGFLFHAEKRRQVVKTIFTLLLSRRLHSSSDFVSPCLPSNAFVWQIASFYKWFITLVYYGRFYFSLSYLSPKCLAEPQMPVVQVSL